MRVAFLGIRPGKPLQASIYQYETIKDGSEGGAISKLQLTLG
jgi:hypothetical protein